MHRGPPLTTDICAVRKHKGSSGDFLYGRSKVKEKKGSALSHQGGGGKRKSSHPKRIMHGVTKVSSREETATEKKQGGTVERLLACEDLWEEDRRGGPGPPWKMTG